MNKMFWKAALKRALRTMAQCAIGYIGAGTMLADVNWLGALSSAVMGGIVSLLMAIGTGIPEAPFEDKGGGDDAGE